MVVLYNFYPRLLTDAFEDKSPVKRTFGERIEAWLVDTWHEAVDFRVSMDLCSGY